MCADTAVIILHIITPAHVAEKFRDRATGPMPKCRSLLWATISRLTTYARQESVVRG